jgi:hypothetical protein
VIDELVQARSDTYFAKRDITKIMVVYDPLRKLKALFLHDGELRQGRKSERGTIRTSE